MRNFFERKSSKIKDSSVFQLFSAKIKRIAVFLQFFNNYVKKLNFSFLQDVFGGKYVVATMTPVEIFLIPPKKVIDT